MSPGLHTLRRMAAQGIIPVLSGALAERRARLKRRLGAAYMEHLAHRAEYIPHFDPTALPPRGWRFWSADFGDRPEAFLRHMADPARLVGFSRAERDVRLSLWKRHCPEAVEACIRQARALVVGDFRAFVPPSLPMPDGVRWHTMIDACGEWPCLPISHYRHLDTDPALRADVRLTWEINRFQHGPILAGAYLATGETVFLECLMAHLESWMAQNPAGMGVNWLQAQETGIRASALACTFVLVGDADVFPDGFRLRWLALIHQLARVTALTHGDGPVTHNHLVSEAAALAVVGLLLPELAGAPGWRSRGLRLLRREAAKQVYPSGIHAEQATAYHFFVMESLAWTLAAQGFAGESLDPLLTETLLRLARAGERLLREDGDCWRVGDCDDGRALRAPGDVSTSRDGWLWLAFSLCGENRCGPVPEQIWFSPRLPAYPCSRPTDQRPLVAFVDAGIASLHSGQTRLLFAAGATRRPTGVPPNHRHADCLSVVLEHRGRVLLDDPGVLRYGPEREVRVAYRRTTAHNAPCVDGGDCLDVSQERFGVGTPPLVRDFQARWDGSCARFSASHDGYPKLQLRRDVWLFPDRLLVLVDRLFAEEPGRHSLSAGFFTPWCWEPNADAMCITKDSSVLARLVCLSPGAGFGPVEAAQIAPRYGVARPAWRVTASTNDMQPCLVCALALDESVDLSRIVCQRDGERLRVMALGRWLEPDDAWSERKSR